MHQKNSVRGCQGKLHNRRNFVVINRGYRFSFVYNVQW